MSEQSLRDGKQNTRRTSLSATLHNTNLTPKDLRMNEFVDVRRHDVQVKVNGNGQMVETFLGD